METKENAPQKERCLLFRFGKVDIRTTKREEIKFERAIPEWSARFQVNKQLYVCGGKRQVNGQPDRVASFFSLDYSGKSRTLQSMEYKRNALSLSGYSKELMALGGWDRKNLKIGEKYLVSVNKWVELPPLNIGRHFPGSLLLKSRRAFCFCGSHGPQNRVNSIESIQLAWEGEWKTLPLNGKIAKTYHLAAVPYLSRVMLFGGASHASYNMYKLDEEGNLLEDLSGDPLIPGAMCQGSFVVEEGKLYAMG